LLVQVSVCDADRLADMIRSDSELLHFGCQLGRICGGTVYLHANGVLGTVIRVQVMQPTGVKTSVQLQ